MATLFSFVCQKKGTFTNLPVGRLTYAENTEKASSQLFFIVVQPRVSMPNLGDLGLDGFWGLFSGANDEWFISLHSYP